MEDQSFKFKYQILNNCVVTSNNEEVANYVNLFISNFLNYEINIDYLMLNSPTNQILCPMLHICRAIIFYFDHSFEFTEKFKQSVKKAKEQCDQLIENNIKVEEYEKIWIEIFNSQLNYNVKETCKLFLAQSIEAPNNLLGMRMAMIQGLRTGNKNFFVKLIENYSRCFYNEDNEYFLGMKAFLLCETKNFSDCEKYLKKGLIINNKNIWIQHVYSHLYFSLGLFHESIEYLNKCKKYWVFQNTFIYKHINWHLAISYMDVGEFDKSEELIEMILAFELNDPECLLNIYGYLIRMVLRENISFLNMNFINKLINYGFEESKLMKNLLYDLMLIWFISFLFNLNKYDSNQLIKLTDPSKMIQKIKIEYRVENEDELFYKYFEKIKSNSNLIEDENYKTFIKKNYLHLLNAMICFGKKDYYNFVKLFVENESELVNIGASDEQREFVIEIAIFCSDKCSMLDYTQDLILKYFGYEYNSTFVKFYLDKIKKEKLIYAK